MKPSKVEYSIEDYTRFSNMYEYVPNDDFDITISCLTKIYDYLYRRKTKLVLLLGSERKYPGKTSPTYKNREKEHQLLNLQVRKWAVNKENVYFIPCDKYVTSDKFFVDTINHFTKNIYYLIARDLITLIQDDSRSMKVKGKLTVLKSLALQKMSIALKNTEFCMLLRQLKSNLLKKS